MHRVWRFGNRPGKNLVKKSIIPGRNVRHLFAAAVLGAVRTGSFSLQKVIIECSSQYRRKWHDGKDSFNLILYC
jgi:hypothetical protein